MFAKLLKYDLRATLKYWWITALATLGISFLGGVCIKIVRVDYTELKVIKVTATLLLILSVIAVVLFALLATLFIYVRFFKNLFTDEGYLTFTLPVKKTAILNSKLLSGVLVYVFTLLAVAIEGVVMFSIGFSELLTKSFFTKMWNTISVFFKGMGAFAPIFIIEMILLFAVLAVFTVLVVDCCITIAAVIAKKHKVLTAVAVYYVFGALCSTVTQIVLSLGMYRVFDYFDAFTGNAALAVVSLALLMVLTLSVALTGVIYICTNALLEHKLNLE